MEKIDNMRYDELFSYTFKALRHRLGHDRPKDQRPLWQRRLSADSDFCRAVVACGYLSREQMLRPAGCWDSPPPSRPCWSCRPHRRRRR